MSGILTVPSTTLDVPARPRAMIVEPLPAFTTRLLYCRECGGTCGGHDHRHVPASSGTDGHVPAPTALASKRLTVARQGTGFRLMYAAGSAVPLKSHNGSLASARSKTGSAECSQAVSDWKRHGQAKGSQTALTLAKCRAMARVKGQAVLHRAAGNEGRAQHLEHVAASAHVTGPERGAQAKSLKLERLERLAGKAQGRHESLAAASAPAPRYQAGLDRSIGLKRAAQREEDRIAGRKAELGAQRPPLKPGTMVAVAGLGARPYRVVATSTDKQTVHVRPDELTPAQQAQQRGRYGAFDRHVGAEDVYHHEHAHELAKLGLAETALKKGNRALAAKILGPEAEASAEPTPAAPQVEAPAAPAVSAAAPASAAASSAEPAPLRRYRTGGKTQFVRGSGHLPDAERFGLTHGRLRAAAAHENEPTRPADERATAAARLKERHGRLVATQQGQKRVAEQRAIAASKVPQAAAAAAPAPATATASAPSRPAKGSPSERLAVLANRAGGRARDREAAADLRGRDINLSRKARLQAAHDTATGKVDKPFGLSARGKPASMFANAGAGKAASLFGSAEPVGAARQDLPGQTNFLGSEHEYKPGRERADLRTAEAPPEMSLRERAESARLAKGLSGAARSGTASRLKALRERLRTDPASHTNHAPGTITPLATEHIHFDPERFQYKLAHNAQTGSVGSLEGVKSWNPELAGIMQVWKDPANGKVFVVNGHNRLDRAKRLAVPKVNVQFIQAANAEEAKAKGALTNIAEGHGTAVDAANFFKNTGISPQHLESHGITMKGKLASEGSSLAKLDDPLFRRVLSGTLDEGKATMIGGSGLEPHHQHAVVKQLDKAPKGRAISSGHLRELLANATAAGSAKTKTFDLFGENEEETSLALHRAKVQDTIKDRLAHEKRLFGTVAKARNAANLARAGNQLNTAESGRVSQEAAGALDVFDRLRNLSGPVSHALNRAAERIHAGEHPKKVTDEAYEHVLRATDDVLRGGSEAAA